ncbi:hypothetical protein MCBG_03385 [Micromonospora sp. M42]|uniref:hypothetical protein n=1 Tax=Micromonospora sp. M42 TaxID=457406 RepID=UPI0003EEB57E|nr:hypothetical protein [Micromonospora sp. M42]EWM66252.1 hypothetical protein MCBG_03385 [Micromonospora sp. M42]
MQPSVVPAHVDLRPSPPRARAGVRTAGPGRRERGQAGGRRTKGYDESFLNAFALRIGDRLREASAAAAGQSDDDRLLPVLAARSDAVRERVDQLFPGTTRHRLQVRDEQGWVSGTSAADRASLDPGRPARRPVRGSR